MTVRFVCVENRFRETLKHAGSKMSYAESEAVFLSRAKVAGLSDGVIKKLVEKDVKTFAILAFVSEYNPGAASEKPLIDTFEEILGRKAEVVEKSSFRRLFHEAYALVTQEMKAVVEKSDDSVNRKLSQPERSDRYKRQCDKLTGMTIKGPNEPSDSLVDMACNMYDANRIKWIEWSKCTSKEQEMHGDKREASFTLNGGVLKVEAKSPDINADTTSEIMIQYALTRRALAFDQANLIDFLKFQTWTSKIIKARIDTPPPGYDRPSVKQLMNADAKLFEEIADRTRNGVQATPSGRPIDVIMDTVMHLPEVCALMQPLPHTRADPSNKLRDDKLERFQPYVKGGKGKSKGKKGSKGTFVRMPVPLIGCHPTTNRGEPICFSYNLNTCSEKVDKGRCSRGIHVCCAPKCGGAHPAIGCDKRPSKSS